MAELPPVFRDPKVCFCDQAADQIIICPRHGVVGPHNRAAAIKAGKRRVPPVTPRNLKFYTDKLKAREPFALARYGDGEWLTILGYIGGHNSNGCTFTQALSDDLRKVLRRGLDYDHGLLGIARRRIGHYIHAFLQREKIDLTFVKGDVLLNENLAGRLFPFVEQLRERRIIYLCPRHCRGMGKRRLGLFDPVTYLHPPKQNAHREKRNILGALENLIPRYRIDTVLFSSGLASKVFIDELWQRTAGEITLIDVGSMFDGYFGVGSRSYIRKGNYDFKKLLRQNKGLLK